MLVGFHVKNTLNHALVCAKFEHVYYQAKPYNRTLVDFQNYDKFLS